jgi:hypothetical protein
MIPRWLKRGKPKPKAPRCAHCGGKIEIRQEVSGNCDADGTENRYIDIWAVCSRCLCSDKGPVKLELRP